MSSGYPHSEVATARVGTITRAHGHAEETRSGLEDDLHALVQLVLEGLVAFGREAELQPVGHDEARVDSPVLDVLVERLEVSMDVALAALERQSLVHEGAARELVEQSSVGADDRHDAARAAGQDGVAQRVPAIAFEPCR